MDIVRGNPLHGVCWLRPMLVAALLTLMAAACFCASAAATRRSFDLKHSVLRVRVSKSGLFSALGHDHEIEAPIAQGELDDGSSPAVRLRVEVAELRVADPGISDSDRAEIQKTMQGPKVLDAANFAEIRFESAAVMPAGSGHWKVAGNLTLHGQTHPVSVDATLKDGVYRGSAGFKQSEFGIAPVSVAGGAVKVKDEVRIEFEVAVAQ
jgi:polyisoprenoid-binding protein YceI